MENQTTGDLVALKPEGEAEAPAEMEEKEEGPGGCRGGLILGAPSARADAGEGACPCDRCCPDLVEARVGGSRRAYKKEFFKGARKREKETSASSRTRSSIEYTFSAGGAAEDCNPQSISFQHLAAAMPRWILKTKTKFAAHLTKTFHLQCGGTTPSSVVFPLPPPELCLFRGGRHFLGSGYCILWWSLSTIYMMASRKVTFGNLGGGPMNYRKRSIVVFGRY